MPPYELSDESDSTLYVNEFWHAALVGTLELYGTLVLWLPSSRQFTPLLVSVQYLSRVYMHAAVGQGWFGA
eukprot:364786-Chlamydomonas_euryale.AAC.3